MVWVERVEIHSAAVLPVPTFLTMAATELLDYNQIQEQSPSTGDKPSDSGGLLTWNFRCDPNLAWDPSQSWFAVDVTIRGLAESQAYQPGSGGASGSEYVPDANDLRPFFPLRMFSSMTHIIDGVTIAHTNQPYADKLIQERYLKENTQSNLSNFEASLTARMIDAGDPVLNPWMQHIQDSLGADGTSAAGQQRGSNTTLHGYAQLGNAPVYIRKLLDPKPGLPVASGLNSNFTNVDLRVPQPTHTILFQPPFDFWTKHQRCSGGNHQIQLVMRPAKGDTRWGSYCVTPCVDLTTKALATFATDASGAINAVAPGTTNPSGTENRGIDIYQGSKSIVPSTGASQTYGNVHSFMQHQLVVQSEYKKHSIVVDIPRIRLLRRMVRFTVERPLSVQEFNLTEMQFYHGTPSTDGVTQNFLLPSSTFGLVFYWRKSTNSDYDVIGDFPKIDLEAAYQSSDFQGNSAPTNTDLASLRKYQLWHSGSTASQTYNVYKFDKADGEFLLDQFYFTYGGETYPSQRVSNIGFEQTPSTSEPLGYEKLQVLSHQLQGVFNMPQENMNMRIGAGQGLINRLDDKMFFFPVAKHNNSDNSDLQVYWSSKQGVSASLVVVALYDARVELAYNAANQLERVTKTEWK